MFTSVVRAARRPSRSSPESFPIVGARIVRTSLGTGSGRPSRSSLPLVPILAILACGLVLGSGSTNRAFAQDACLESTLPAAGVTTGNRYGLSMARSGPFLAVGAPGYSAVAPAAGGVFVYAQFGATWQPSAILFPTGLVQGDSAGSSLAMDGTTLVVGMRRDDAMGLDSGAAAVFEFTGLGWVQVATLVDPTGGPLDEFGSSVAISGDVIVVGSPYDANIGGDELGSATVFRRVAGDWQFDERIEATFGEHGDAFGSAVAVAGDWIAVGEPEDNGTAGIDTGSVTVFRDTGPFWSEFAFLESPNASAGDMFGTAVAMTGDTLLVGAPFSSPAGFESGGVYPFRRDGTDWLGDPVIVSPIAAANRFFGSAIDIDGTEVAIGEPFTPVAGSFAAGAAHYFIDNGSAFGAIATVTDATPSSGALLGSSVAIEGGELVSGAALDNANGFASGAAHRFIVGGPDCDASGVPDLCEIADGSVVDCNQNGIPDSCDLANGTAEDCDGNGNLDSCDLAGGATDCDLNGVLDACELAEADCNLNGVLDGCEDDCNGNGSPDDCDIDLGLVPDCNGNGNPDDCDIFFGISTDCDDNAIPDECDLATGAAEDCNANGIADSCDVLFGTSLDDNGDGIPDECGVVFVRGDVNGDALVDLADAVSLLGYVSTEGDEPPCIVAADANGDAQLNVADGAYLISFLSMVGPPPPAPFPGCGFEPVESGLECAVPPVCP